MLVFGLAGRALGEPAHRGVDAVVGNAFDDAEARPAMGAVDEGIAVAPVAGIVQFAQAGRAGGEIGHHHGGRRTPVIAGQDAKRFMVCGRSGG
jgi:hypothetical protein